MEEEEEEEEEGLGRWVGYRRSAWKGGSCFSGWVGGWVDEKKVQGFIGWVGGWLGGWVGD